MKSSGLDEVATGGLKGEPGLAGAAPGNTELADGLAASDAAVRLKGAAVVELDAPLGAKGERGAAGVVVPGVADAVAAFCAAGFMSSPSRVGFSSAGDTIADLTGAVIAGTGDVACAVTGALMGVAGLSATLSISALPERLNKRPIPPATAPAVAAAATLPMPTLSLSGVLGGGVAGLRPGSTLPIREANPPTPAGLSVATA